MDFPSLNFSSVIWEVEEDNPTDMVINVNDQPVHFNPADVLSVPPAATIQVFDELTVALDNAGSPILAVYGTSVNYSIPVEIQSSSDLHADVHIISRQFWGHAIANSGDDYRVPHEHIYINGEQAWGERLLGVHEVAESAELRQSNGNFQGLHISLYPLVKHRGTLARLDGHVVTIFIPEVGEHGCNARNVVRNGQTVDSQTLQNCVDARASMIVTMQGPHNVKSCEIEKSAEELILDELSELGPTGLGVNRINLSMFRKHFKASPTAQLYIGNLAENYESARFTRNGFQAIGHSFIEALARSPGNDVSDFMVRLDNDNTFNVSVQNIKTVITTTLHSIVNAKSSEGYATTAHLINQLLSEQDFSDSLTIIMQWACANYLYTNQHVEELTRMIGNQNIQELSGQIVSGGGERLDDLELTWLSKALSVTIVVTRLPGPHDPLEPDTLKTAKVYRPSVMVAPILHLLTDGANFYMLYPYEFNAVDGYVNKRFDPTNPPCQMPQIQWPFKGTIPYKSDPTVLRQYAGKLDGLIQTMQDVSIQGFDILKKNNAFAVSPQFTDWVTQVHARLLEYPMYPLLGVIHPDLFNADELKKSSEKYTNYVFNYSICPLCGERQKMFTVQGCRHSFCNECIKLSIWNQTQGKYILSQYEAHMQPRCPEPGCSQQTIISQDQIMGLLDEEELWLCQKDCDQRVDFVLCQNCGSSVNFSNMLYLECRHKICGPCGYNAFEQGRICLCCGSPSQQIDALGTVLQQCAGCHQEKPYATEFPHIVLCDVHTLVCKDCLGINTDQCIVWDIPFPYEKKMDVLKVARIQTQNCVSCNIDKTWPEFVNLCSCNGNICRVWQVSYSNAMIQSGQEGNFCVQCGSTIQPDLYENIRNELFVGSNLLAESIIPKQAIEFYCDMCMDTHPIGNKVNLSCDHYCCKDCFSGWLDVKINSKDFESGGIKCFDAKCYESIVPSILAKHMSPKQDEKYNDFILELSGVMIWPNCNMKFYIDNPNLKNAQCFSCRHNFCIKCKNPPHPEDGCEAERVRQALKLLKDSDLGDQMLAQCPGCKEPYLKDNSCEHVKCLNCRTEFCFRCSCIRSPTMSHGAHYHRPQCTFYAEYNGDDDQYDEKCTECLRLGRLCDRPEDLPVPRLFDIEEIPDDY